MKQSSPSKQQLEILRNAMLLSFTQHAWRNRAKDSTNNIEVEANKAELRLTKRLVVCAQYEAIRTYMAGIYTWCISRSMLSSVRRGVYFVRRDMVEEFEAKFAEANEHLAKVLVPAFLAPEGYAAAKERAKLPRKEDGSGGLGTLYNEDDYPEADELRKAFYIDHSWLALSVPDELPEEIRERENDKLRKSFADAQEEIQFALREGMKSLIDRAVAILEPKPGEKEKTFKSNSLDKLNEFFETFRARNMMNDAQLEELVKRAKAIVNDMPNEKRIRNNSNIRAQVAQQFKTVAANLDRLVSERPSRKFSLDD